MNTVPSAKIRNVALVGHGGSGKTTLAEALLVVAGVLTRAGRIEDGTTVCDFEPEEMKRQMSVSLALAPFLYEDCKINIIDTPGLRRLRRRGRGRALGRRPRRARRERRRRCGGADRGDLAAGGRARASPASCSSTSSTASGPTSSAPSTSSASVFGAGIAPLELPIGAEAAIRGIADLLTDTAITYDGRQAHDRAHPRRDLPTWSTRCASS